MMRYHPCIHLVDVNGIFAAQGSSAQVFRKFELPWTSSGPAPTPPHPMRTDIGGNDHLHEICPQEVSMFGCEAWHKD